METSSINGDDLRFQKRHGFPAKLPQQNVATASIRVARTLLETVALYLGWNGPPHEPNSSLSFRWDALLFV